VEQITALISQNPIATVGLGALALAYIAAALQQKVAA
jgi:hypothetical protein